MKSEVIIFGLTLEVANNKLEKLHQLLGKNLIQIYKKSENYSVIILSDGTIYRAIKVGDSSRGYRWNYAYIDRNISEDILNTIILPTGVGKYGAEFY